MRRISLIAVAGVVCTLLAPQSQAQEAGRSDGMRFLPNVEDQFVAMTGEGADALGFHVADTPDPSHCQHYQGIVRVDAADGTPYFLVTRSGNIPEDVAHCSTGDVGLGNLIVVRMESRPTHGERLRSNRLRKGIHVDATTPPAEDAATTFFSFKDGGLVQGSWTPSKGYSHPGGMQLVGHTLAVAVEAPYIYLSECWTDQQCHDELTAPNPTLIMFFDVSDPSSPVFTSQFAPVRADGTALTKAGVVAVTPLPNGLYLLATTGGDGTTVYFYRSTVADLSSESLSWELVGHDTPEVDDHPQQTLQFLREGDIDGDLYLAGVRGHPVFGSEHDKADLYRVECQTTDCAPGESITQTIVRRGRVVNTYPRAGGGRLANGAAASTFHVTPSGELLLYVTEHDNDGPAGTVKAGEWASRFVVRDGSPTTSPSVTVDGAHVVDEGSILRLEGSAQPPTTKAWFKYYHETGFAGLSAVVDFDDYALDDFDNLANFETRPFGTPIPQAGVARSWRWFAPVGCSVIAVDHTPDGTRARVFAGTGQMVSVADLRTELPDMDGQLDAVAFGDDCDAYYGAPVKLEWDLDRNGSFETTGSPVTLDTEAFDGPSVVDVPAQARHPSGQTSATTATVTVRNVAPRVAPLRVVDAAGNQVGVDVPLVLTGRPVSVFADFTDAGTLDRQTASIAWGDGVTDPHTAVSFDEAFGDGAGSASHTHRYSLPGSYTIAVEVRDDDGGVGSADTVVHVGTPAQAVRDVIAALDDLIAGNPNIAVASELERARKSLAGSNEHSNDGALAMIESGNAEAAKAFLQQAISRLRNAQLAGADVTTEIALLEQVIAAL